MGRSDGMDKRLEEQNRKKRRQSPDDGPDDMELELERERMTALNKRKSVFDTDGGNRSPGINTAPSVFEKTAVFNTTE